MNPYLLGDWPAIQAFVEGVKTQTSVLNLFAGGGNLRWVIGALLVTGFSLVIWRLVSEKKFRHLTWVVFVPVWLSICFKPVDVSLPSPAIAPALSDSVSAAELDLKNAQSFLSQAKSEPGQPRLEEAQAQVAQANADLIRLRQLEQAGGGKVGVVSAPFSFVFGQLNALAVNLWEAIDAVAWNDVSLVDRLGQAAIAKQLSFQAGLSPTEKLVADGLAECLKAKQIYSEQMVKVKKWADEGVQPTGRSGLSGEELAAAWSDVLLPTRQQAEDACQGADDNLYAAIDKSITEEEVRSFTHAFTIGKFGFFKLNNAQKKKELAAMLGVAEGDLDGRSEEEIAKMFLRQKKLAAMSGELQRKLEASGTGMTATRDPGLKAAAGSWVAEALGGFAQSMKPFMTDSLNFCLKFVVAFFPIAVLLSLIPGAWKKAMLGYVFGLSFVLLWQVMVLTIEKHTAEIMRVEVAAQGGSDSWGDTTRRLLVGTWNQLTGNAGTGEVVAGGAVAAAAAKTSVGRQAIMDFLTYAKMSPQGFLASSALSGVVIAATAGVDADAKLDSEQARFDKIIRGEIGVSPALADLASGMIDVQRAQIQEIHARAEMNSALWLLASPFLTIIFLMGGWALIGSAAGMAGPMVAQIGQQVGSTIGSAVGGAATRMGGMGGRIGGGKGGIQ